jgi:CheY-like chemotaxis protein
VIAEEPMDMRTLVNSCEEIIRGQVLSRELEFQCETEEFSHPYLLGDELHLRQILINILGNAVKFTQDGGTVRFTVKERQQTGDKVIYRFIIEDNGIGMSEEFQTRIFEAFSQENDNSRTHYNGTGLGMAITKQFVDLMGGTIRVKSKLNEGSAFTVDLPFRVDADREEEPEEAMEDQLVDLTGMKVLLVEDNELNLEIAREILQAEGIRITVAANGEEAVERFKESEEGEFDLVLMDIMMPVMNGYEASQTIRSLDRQDAKNVPIVAMTANAYEEDVKNAFSAGMNAHIPKPVDVDLLIQVLGRYRTS